jgi:hypothetical protein
MINRYRKYFKEELLDGMAIFDDDSADEESGDQRSYKVPVRKIESKAEYNKLLARAESPRGIITNSELYLLTQDSYEVVHEALIKFLIKKGIINKDLLYNGGYEDNFNTFLTVQVNWGEIYIGESYPSSFKIAVRKNLPGHPEYNPNDPPTPEYLKVKEYFEVLDRLKIPYEMDFI